MQEIKALIEAINAGVFGAEIHLKNGDEGQRTGATKNGAWTPEGKDEDRRRRKEATFPAGIRSKAHTMVELLKKHLIWIFITTIWLLT